MTQPTKQSSDRSQARQHETSRADLVGQEGAVFLEEPELGALQRAIVNPNAATPADISALARRYGNRAVQRLLAQRQPEEEELQTKPSTGQRGGAEGLELDDATAGRIYRARGGGQPLDGTLQAQMGQAMDYDLSAVRVHTDAEADELNQQLSARAFTTGQDVFFREGAYDPGSGSGRELIAHELSHVVQQSSGRVSGDGSGVTVRPAGDTFEQEADRVANEAAAAVSSPVQRQLEEEEEPVQSKSSVQQQPEEEETIQGKPLVQRQEEVVQTQRASGTDGLSRGLRAKAFAAGPAVFFKQGAHDATSVVQREDHDKPKLERQGGQLELPPATELRGSRIAAMANTVTDELQECPRTRELYHERLGDLEEKYKEPVKTTLDGLLFAHRIAATVQKWIEGQDEPTKRKILDELEQKVQRSTGNMPDVLGPKKEDLVSGRLRIEPYLKAGLRAVEWRLMGYAEDKAAYESYVTDKLYNEEKGYERRKEVAKQPARERATEEQAVEEIKRALMSGTNPSGFTLKDLVLGVVYSHPDVKSGEDVPVPTIQEYVKRILIDKGLGSEMLGREPTASEVDDEVSRQWSD